jgi:hypothetical protein
VFVAACRRLSVLGVLRSRLHYGRPRSWSGAFGPCQPCLGPFHIPGRQVGYRSVYVLCGRIVYELTGFEQRHAAARRRVQLVGGGYAITSTDQGQPVAVIADRRIEKTHRN